MYRHEKPTDPDDPLADQNIKDRFFGINDPVADKLMRRYDSMPKLDVPEDKLVTTLYVGNLADRVSEKDLRYVGCCDSLLWIRLLIIFRTGVACLCPFCTLQCVCTAEKTVVIASSVFTARRYSSTVYAAIMCPSIRPSVTSRSSVRMVKSRITQTMPCDSPGNIVCHSRAPCRMLCHER